MWPAEIGLLAWVISGFIGVLFLAAALHKLQDPMLFYAQVDAYRLLPTSWSWWLSKFLPWLEILLVVLMFVPVTAHMAAWVAAALLFIYGAAIAVNVVRGRDDLDCGCGGPSVRISWKLVARNVLMALAIGTAPFYQFAAGRTWDIAVAAGCGIVIWMVYALYEKVRSMLGGNHLISSSVMKSK